MKFFGGFSVGMNSDIKRNSIFAIIIFVLYLCQNVVRNLLVNMLAINEIIATAITVVVFGILAMLLVKRECYFKVINKDKFCLSYIVVVTLILCAINLFPFDVSIDISIISVIVQMLFVGLMEELIFRGCVYRICDIKFGSKKAIVAGSILFGLIHIINVLNDDILMVVLQMLYATSIGIVFSGLIYKKQGIHLCVLAHSIINITANLGATETAFKEIIFSAASVCLAIIMIVRLKWLEHEDTE